jgi:hypothetical protein
MNLHSACRALLSGATLLAATAMAAPAPCLAPRQPASEQQQPTQKYAPWRNPCHLVDAQKPENEQKNEGEDKPKDVSQLLDDIEMFTHLNMPPEGEQQLPWFAADERAHGDAVQWPLQGGPGSWSHYAHPLYHAEVSGDTLHSGGAQVNASMPAVPEPAHVAMLLAGLAVVAAVARKRRQP